MKKFLAIFAAVALLAGLTACAQGTPGTATTGETSAETTAAETTAAETTVGETEIATDSTQANADVLGSWILNEVYKTDGATPELLKRSEAASLYGTGTEILTFDADGVGHSVLFNAGGEDMTDHEGTWKTTTPDTYVYNANEGPELTFTYNKSENTLHRELKDTAADATYPSLDFVYARAITGSWKMTKVIGINEGDAPTEFAKEDHQSLYSIGDNVYNFSSDGKVEEVIKDGADTITESGTWKMDDADHYILSVPASEMEFNYFRLDDTLQMDVIDESSTALHPHLQFIFTRIVNEETTEQATTAAQSFTEETTTAAQETTTASADDEDELINDGKIFTGNTIDLYDPETGYKVTLSELSQGGWAKTDTGIIYTQEAGGGEHFYGNDGSMLITENLYNSINQGNRDALDTGGPRLTGNTIEVYDSETGDQVVLWEVAQGGWIDKTTGFIFYQEEGGGGRFYGSDGSMLVTDYIYNQMSDQPEGVDNGGPSLTGNKLTLYSPVTGEAVVVDQIAQGGYVNTATGVIYTQEGGGGDHFYGSDGSVLVTEYYYNENIKGN